MSFFNLFLFITCFSFVNSIKGQQFSTVAEIYDYNIGDIFQYKNTEGDYYHAQDISYKWIEIVNKYYSSSNDTLFYVQERHEDIQQWNLYNTDTIIYTNLDSIIAYNDEFPNDLDSVYTSINEYNGRKINYYYHNEPYYGYQQKWVDGLGRARSEYWSADFHSLYEIIYYKKGNEEYGTSVSVNEIEKSDNKIKIYPNPANNHIKIRGSSDELKNVTFFNLLGENVTNYIIKTNTNSNSISYNIENLNEGVYFVKTLSGTVKFIKE